MDILNSVRNNVEMVMNAVQELRQSRELNVQRAKEFMEQTSKSMLDAAEKGEITKNTCNRSLHILFRISHLLTQQFMTQNLQRSLRRLKEQPFVVMT